MRDRMKGKMVRGEYGYYNEEREYGFGRDSGVGIEYCEGESLFVDGDSVVMESLDENRDWMLGEMRGLDKVGFYGRDVEGRGDWLVFCRVESCVRMYGEGIMWKKKEEVLGEVIKVYMKESRIEWWEMIGEGVWVEGVD